jgi:hypothetical protein
VLLVRFYQLQRWSGHVGKASFRRSTKFGCQSAADAGLGHQISAAGRVAQLVLKTLNRHVLSI